jgi:hypothetical protein
LQEQKGQEVKKPSAESICQVVSFIDALTQGSVSQVIQEFDLCPFCFGSLITDGEGERTCSKCGSVAYEETPTVRDGFWIGDTHSPVNALCIGHGLGGTLQLKGRWCVLDRVSNDRPDLPNNLPVRGRSTDLRVEHVKIEAMLRRGSMLCNAYGFGVHSDRKSVVFSNLLGKIIRSVGAYAILSGSRANTGVLADSCFFATYKYADFTKYPSVGWMDELGVNSNSVESVQRIYELLHPLHLQACLNVEKLLAH